MNLGSTNPYGNGLLYAGFNQDQGCFACATTTGFRIYNCDPLKEKERQDFDNGGLSYVEMLFRCNYLALVGGGAKPLYPTNKVIVWDDLKKTTPICLEFNAPVLAVRLRRDRIVVVLARSSCTCSRRTRTRRGCACSVPTATTPSWRSPAGKTGHVQLVDLANTEKSPLDIVAHEANLSCIALNLQGTRLATASEKGTLIRVFNTTSGQKVAELRRGGPPGDHLLHQLQPRLDVSLRVLRPRHRPHLRPGRPQAEQAVDAGQRHLLAQVLPSTWSFCKFTVPNGPPCICAFGADSNSVIVICADGCYYKFVYNLKGECVREQCAQFLEMTDDNS
ncbi:hypothetical protein NQ318_002977 [Aromia moschata]|uniref:WD repeat domain phosphoinositide-interacting protein 3 n=1 Tax=Aromia moschata TaxID=1265417 RepID=A0AAV8YRW2_9CUCU|nr:hypothetical protein NQ318_002977 [Aromia moschata]